MESAGEPAIRTWSDSDLERLLQGTPELLQSAVESLKALQTVKTQLEEKVALSQINAEQRFHKLEQDLLLAKREEMSCRVRMEELDKVKQTLTKDLSNLREEVSTLSTKLAKAKALCTKHEVVVEDLHREKEELLQSIASKDGRMQDLREELESAKQSLAQQKSLANKAISENSEAQEAFRRSKVELSAAQRDLEEANAANKHTEEQLKQHTEKWAQMREEMFADLAALRQRNESLQFEEDASTKAAEQARSRLAEKSRELSELQMQLKEKAESFIEIEAALKEEVVNKDRACKFLQCQLDEARQQLSSLEVSSAEMKSELRIQKQNHANSISEFEAKQSACQKRLDEALEHVDELTKELDQVASLRQQLKASSDQRSAQDEQSIQRLLGISPAAAAARLQQQNLSLTQVYEMYTQVVEALHMERDERLKVEAYLKSILAELEVKGPMIEQQRQEWEQAINSHRALGAKLEEAMRHKSLADVTVRQYKKKMDQIADQRNALELENNELKKEVAHILRQLESVRRGSVVDRLLSYDEIKENHSTDSFVSEHLSKFGNLEQLVQRHTELLATVHSLGKQVDENVLGKKEAELQAAHDKITAFERELQELKLERERQQQLVETIVHQRDLFKSLSQKQSSARTPAQGGASANSSSFVGESEQVLEDKLSKLQGEFDEYRSSHEQAMTKIRSDLEDAQSQAQKSAVQVARLEAQAEFFEKSYQASKADLEAGMKEMSTLQSNCQRLSALVVQHQTTLESKEREIQDLGTRLRSETSGKSKLDAELQGCKALQASLEADKAALRGDVDRLLQVQTSISSSAQSESEHSKKTIQTLRDDIQKREKELESAREQLASARRTVEDVTFAAQVKEADLRKVQAKSETRVVSLLEENAQLKGNVSGLNAVVANLEKRVESLDSKAVGTPSGAAGGAATIASSDPERISALEAELMSSNSKLADKQAEADQWKNMAKSFEQTLQESTNGVEEFKQQTAAEMESLREKCSQLNATLSKTKEELVTAETKAINAEASAKEEQRKAARQAELARADALQELSSVQKQAARSAELEQQCAALRQMNREAQSNYERELLAHTESVKQTQQEREKSVDLEKQLNRLRTELGKECDDAKANVMQLEQRLSTSEHMCTSQKQRLDELTNHNTLLHQQLEKLQGRLEASSVDSDNTVAAGSSETTEKELRELIRHLRREKDLALARLDAANAEIRRIKHSTDANSRQLESVKQELAQAHQKLSANTAGSSAEFAELKNKLQELTLLRESNVTLREQMTQYQNKSNSLDLEVSKLRNVVGPLQEREKVLSKEKEALEDSLRAKETLEKELRDSIARILSKNESVDPAELAQLRQAALDVKRIQPQLESCKKQVQEMEANLKSAETKYTSWKAKHVNNQQKMKEMYEGKLKQAEDSENDAQEAKEELESQLEDKVKEIQALHRKLSQANQAARSNAATAKKVQSPAGPALASSAPSKAALAMGAAAVTSPATSTPTAAPTSTSSGVDEPGQKRTREEDSEEQPRQKAAKSNTTSAALSASATTNLADDAPAKASKPKPVFSKIPPGVAWKVKKLAGRVKILYLGAVDAPKAKPGAVQAAAIKPLGVAAGQSENDAQSTSTQSTETPADKIAALKAKALKTSAAALTAKPVGETGNAIASASSNDDASHAIPVSAPTSQPVASSANSGLPSQESVTDDSSTLLQKQALLKQLAKASQSTSVADTKVVEGNQTTSADKSESNDSSARDIQETTASDTQPTEQLSSAEITSPDSETNVQPSEETVSSLAPPSVPPPSIPPPNAEHGAAAEPPVESNIANAAVADAEALEAAMASSPSDGREGDRAIDVDKGDAIPDAAPSGLSSNSGEVADAQATQAESDSLDAQPADGAEEEGEDFDEEGGIDETEEGTIEDGTALNSQPAVVDYSGADETADQAPADGAAEDPEDTSGDQQEDQDAEQPAQSAEDSAQPDEDDWEAGEAEDAGETVDAVETDTMDGGEGELGEPELDVVADTGEDENGMVDEAADGEMPADADASSTADVEEDVMEESEADGDDGEE